MAKLTRRAIKNHEKALEMSNRLSAANDPEERGKMEEFIFTHFDPAYNHLVTKNQAYFTPLETANDIFGALAISPAPGERVLDLCAGIGVLSYALRDTLPAFRQAEYICVERETDYIEMGKKLCPWAEWRQGDMIDLLSREEKFDYVIVNPPFSGKVEAPGLPFTKSYQAALAIGLQVLREGGEMMAILPAGALYRLTGDGVNFRPDFKDPARADKKFLNWAADYFEYQPSLYRLHNGGFKNTNINVGSWFFKRRYEEEDPEPIKFTPGPEGVIDPAKVAAAAKDAPRQDFITTPDARKVYRLIPPDIAPQIPKLYQTENEKDPIVWLKWFTPDALYTWYITEYDPAKRLCFGVIDNQGYYNEELGYISLDEVLEVRGQMGLPVERDIHWTPKPLSEAKEEIYLRRYGPPDDEEEAINSNPETTNQKPETTNQKLETTNQKPETQDNGGKTQMTTNYQFSQLNVHPAQMRSAISIEGMASLTQQVLEAGLDPNRPVVVTPDGFVISGHRRWLAAMLAAALQEEDPRDEYDLETVEKAVRRTAEAVGGDLTRAYDYLKDRYPNSEIPVSVFTGDKKAQILALQSANFGQEEADPKGLAHSFAKAVKAGVSPKRIATNIGQPISFVKNHLALAKLPNDLVDLIVSGRLGMSAAPALSDLPDIKREALARVIVIRANTSTPPTVGQVKKAAARLKAFNGFAIPMTSDPAERNRAQVLAAVWQSALDANPKRPWVAVADGAYMDILNAPWNDAQRAAAFIHAFAPSLIVSGRVDWIGAMKEYLPRKTCAACIFASLPAAKLQRELDLPCRKQEAYAEGVCLHQTGENSAFALDVPWEWQGLPGVSEKSPYQVKGAKALVEAWNARREAEEAEEAAERHRIAANLVSSRSAQLPDASKKDAKKAPDEAPKGPTPVEKMRAIFHDYMARHTELPGANHPQATRCAACRHHLDASPTKDETVPHCAWASRLRNVTFSVRRPLNGVGGAVPWCKQYAPKETDWSKIIPEHDGAPAMPREWLIEQIKAASRGASALLEPLTGRPMKSSESYGDWFREQFETQVGNLNDSQLWMLYVWVLADTQRSRNKTHLFPIGADGQIFGEYDVIDWKLYRKSNSK